MKNKRFIHTANCRLLPFNSPCGCKATNVPARNEAMQHTPTPWEVSGEENGIITIRGDIERGRLFAVADTVKWTDAEFIVRAVNAHDDLVAAGEAALRLLYKEYANSVEASNLFKALNKAEGK